MTLYYVWMENKSFISKWCFESFQQTTGLVIHILTIRSHTHQTCGVCYLK